MEKNSLREKAIKAINETIFYPNKEKTDYFNDRGRPDWCVSRQRVWGVPLPIFINKKTKEPLKDKKVIERIAEIYEKRGPIVGLLMMQKNFLDIVDIVVWFDSGSTHSFVLEKDKI